MENTIAVTYRIDKINQLSYSIASKPSDFRIERENVDFNLQTTLALPKEYEGVVVILNIKGVDITTQEELFSFVVENRFHVQNYEEAIKVNQNKSFTIPDNFLLEVFSLSVGAARGMLVLRNSGTYLNDAILSVFNPMDILRGIKEGNENRKSKQAEISE